MGPNGKRIVAPHPRDCADHQTDIEWYATGQCSLAEVTDASLQRRFSLATPEKASVEIEHPYLCESVYTPATLIGRERPIAAATNH